MSQNQPPLDTDTTFLINDGPHDKPNFKRSVKPLCWSTVPGMVLCRDMDSGEILTIDKQKLEQAKKAMLEEQAAKENPS